MTSLEKMVRLARESRFDAIGDEGSVIDEIDLQKVAMLGQGTKYDVCASTSSPRKSGDGIGNVARYGVCHAFTHDGRCVSLFKTLFTNMCSHECNYCPNASHCPMKRGIYSYIPEELASVTMALYRGNYIEGLFLSSGIGRDEDIIMERMIETVEILRHRYRFRGYIHLKILPGADIDHIKRAIELSDRVSINIEAPSASIMSELSYTKDYANDIIQRQRYIRDISKKIKLPAGQTTQLVVGAAGDTDREIFQTVMREYRELGVRRVYYSAFHPVPGTPFQNRRAQEVWREHRLYQIDWLYRVYGLSPGEIELAFSDDGYLENRDPKEVIARRVLDGPVDVNEASYDELIRIPGIGPRGAGRIIRYRQKKRITSASELAAIGIRISRARRYLKINGWYDTDLWKWSS